MSTFYYLICDSHNAVSGVIGGRSFPARWWENAEGELAAFLEAHADCNPVQLVSEHDERVLDFTEVRAAPVQDPEEKR